MTLIKHNFLKHGIKLEALFVFILTLFLSYQFIQHNQITHTSTTSQEETTKKDYIKWVDFNVSYQALDETYQYDIETYNNDVPLHWIELLAYLGAKYGGDFSSYKSKDLTEVVEKLVQKEETIESLTKDMKHYDYYYEVYSAVLDGFVGEYQIESYKSTSSTEPSNTTNNSNSINNINKNPITHNTGSPNPTTSNNSNPENNNTRNPNPTNSTNNNPNSVNNNTSSPNPAANNNSNSENNTTSSPNPTNSTNNPNSANNNTSSPNPNDNSKDSTSSNESSEKKIVWETKYGLKAFSPVAKGFGYSDYDDFGVSRSYGYKRQHLGHDMMGLVGTPIIAVESGYVEAIGWNQYGGWRLGIRSFDKKRYYYYAHLRQNFPYAKHLEEGSIVTAGDVIGYMGHTGYSTTENVNNIDCTHLHFGIQLIFDESQKEGNNEIWIDCYALVRFLYRNRSETEKNPETKEWVRTRSLKDPIVEKYKSSNS